MKQRTNQVLFSYWNEVRAHRLAPRRFEIEPAQIAHILPETFILECIDQNCYRFRLAGTRICEHFGREFRGSNFLDLWQDMDRLILTRQLGSMVDQGAVGILSFELESVDGRRAGFEAVLLPLLHTQQTITRFLGSMSAIDPPAWLGTERVSRLRLLMHELVWPDGRPHSIVRRMGATVPTVSPEEAGRLVQVDRRRFRVYEGGLSRLDSDPSE
ncbi:MAG: PAS domain-containing protein [Hyphomicrobiaceae bacterium]